MDSQINRALKYEISKPQSKVDSAIFNVFQNNSTFLFRTINYKYSCLSNPIIYLDDPDSVFNNSDLINRYINEFQKPLEIEIIRSVKMITIDNSNDSDIVDEHLSNFRIDDVFNFPSHWTSTHKISRPQDFKLDDVFNFPSHWTSTHKISRPQDFKQSLFIFGCIITFSRLKKYISHDNLCKLYHQLITRFDFEFYVSDFVVGLDIKNKIINYLDLMNFLLTNFISLNRAESRISKFLNFVHANPIKLRGMLNLIGLVKFQYVIDFFFSEYMSTIFINDFRKLGFFSKRRVSANAFIETIDPIDDTLKNVILTLFKHKLPFCVGTKDIIVKDNNVKEIMKKDIYKMYEFKFIDFKDIHKLLKLVKIEEVQD